MKQTVAALVALFTISFSLLSAPALQKPDRRMANLAEDQAKLKSNNNPVSRARTQIKITEILISLMADAARDGNVDVVQKWLDQYSAAVEDAHGGLMKSGRDARKRPDGFKELEISIRHQLMQLNDIGDALTFDQRQPVKKARDRAAEIRDDLLKALFGSKNVSPDKP